MIPAWPQAQLVAAIDALGRASFRRSQVETPAAPSGLRDEELDSWVDAAATWCGLEAEPVDIPYAGFDRFIRSAGPALIRSSDGGFVALDAKGRAIGPDLARRAVATEELRRDIFRFQETSAGEDADRLLNACPVSSGRRQSVRDTIVSERLTDAHESGRCWQLRMPPDGSLRSLLQRAGVTDRLGRLALTHVIEYAIWIAAWWMVGRGALQGSLDRGWLLGWALLLLSLIPTRMAATWLQGQIAIRAGGLLKERLLYGALQLEPDEVRHHGAGHFLGQVIEAEAMESLALGGGFLTLVSTIELVASAAVARFGTGSTIIPGLLAAWMVFTGFLLFQYFQRCSQWTMNRLAMTDDLVERMIGHRTRLVQQPKEQWHDVEDQSMDAYHAASSRMDALAPWLSAALPRTWLMIGLAGMAPGFISGSTSPEGLAVRLGAIVLAFRAFKRLGAAAPQLLQALIAWQQTQPLLRPAQRAKPRGLPSLACATAGSSAGDLVIDARDVVFQYRGRQEPVLRACGLQIRAGDRILLDGPSGEGKSTLASVIAGLRKPTSGLVLAGGLDRTSLGVQGWRRRVAVSPQFHENHLITGPLAFNLLMGRQGLIRDADVREAETVCEELGLGELLQRMPAGIMQMVGESGWQLSHGERSRVYLARAVLQNAALVVLDESLAALDAVSLQRAIACIEQRARAVLAIAHA